MAHSARSTRLEQLAVLRYQAGDEQGFVRLFNTYSSDTLAYLRALLGDAADDINQEVWIAVYRRLKSLEDPRRFRTWLFSTTRHRAIDYMRGVKRERELFDASVAEADGPTINRESDSIDELRVVEIMAAMNQLTSAQREVLHLRYVDGLSYAECALVTGCSLGTVRSRLHYAKRKCREILAERMAPRD